MKGKKLLKSIIEGLLFAAGEKGLTLDQLSQILEEPLEKVRETVFFLQKELEEEKRGIRILQFANKFKMTTSKENYLYIQKIAKISKTKLSRAALEVLAIIAYRQPISRLEIDDIRGVRSEKVINLLLQKELIIEVGSSLVGRFPLYGTTDKFLEHLGLKSLDDLPAI